MKKIPLQLKSGLTLLTLTIFFCVNQPASAQSTPAQGTRPAQDRDTTRGELLSFDNFLDQHREIAEQLRKIPSLVNDKEFVKTYRLSPSAVILIFRDRTRLSLQPAAGSVARLSGLRALKEAL
ncbi:MAG TPA: hypothetical protein VNX66_06405 [Candidatus Sulfotelmatobacter sp.]|jgi:hypothetical protein|nr:hypothetical protein [Candidatus Sulfotelmatobacter sp.]